MSINELTAAIAATSAAHVSAKNCSPRASCGSPPDYVSRLTRSNLIDGHQVDGLWFVELASLKNFIPIKNARKKHGVPTPNSIPAFWQNQGQADQSRRA
jgi:hypothetical protein